MERILTHIFKGIIYSTLLGVLGMLASFILGWNALKGAYLFILVAGTLTMLISVFLLIGTPKMREYYYFNKDKKKDPNLGGEGIGPAVMGVVMIIIGFMIESFMH